MEIIESTHLRSLLKQNAITKKNKSIVFELSNYSTKKALNLILCVKNIGKTWARANNIRQSNHLDGRYSFEYDGHQFSKTENQKDLLLDNAILTESLSQTLDTFKSFATEAGYPFCKTLGFYSDKPGDVIYHVWMGDDLGIQVQGVESLIKDWVATQIKLLKKNLKKQKEDMQNVVFYYGNEYYDLQQVHINNDISSDTESAIEQVCKKGDFCLSENAVNVREEKISFNGTPLEVYLDMKKNRKNLIDWFPHLENKIQGGLSEEEHWEILEEVRKQLIYRVAAKVEQQAREGALPVSDNFQAFSFVHDTDYNKVYHQKARNTLHLSCTDYLILCNK